MRRKEYLMNGIGRKIKNIVHDDVFYEIITNKSFMSTYLNGFVGHRAPIIIICGWCPTIDIYQYVTVERISCPGEETRSSTLPGSHTSLYISFHFIFSV